MRSQLSVPHGDILLLILGSERGSCTREPSAESHETLEANSTKVSLSVW